MCAQGGKEQIPQFPQLSTEQPRIIIFVQNFRSSRETPRAGNDLQIPVRSQVLSVATDFTTQADLQWGQELLWAFFTHETSSSRTKHTLLPFSPSSRVSQCHPLTLPAPGHWGTRCPLLGLFHPLPLEQQNLIAQGINGSGYPVKSQGEGRDWSPKRGAGLALAAVCSGRLWSPAAIIASFAAAPCYSLQMPQRV